MIQGHGVSNPRLIFIGDQPHGDDFKTNYALSGYQNSFIRENCRSVDIGDETYYKTLLLKDEPAKYQMKMGIAIPNLVEDMVAKFAPILEDEIRELHPNLLVPMGEVSFRYLTGLKDIRKFRGSVLPSIPLMPQENGTVATMKVMPILGPYPFINQDYKYKYVSRIDFQKVPKYLNDGPVPDLGCNLWICESATALRAYLNRSYDPDGLLVFDIETFMGIPTCISLSFDGIEAVCVPLLDAQIDQTNRVVMWDLVAKLLDMPIKKGNQNIKYDWKILERWGVRVRNVCHDSMLASSTLYCEFPKNLGFLTSIYTDLPYYKDEGKEFDPSKLRRTQFYLYNAKDSLSVHQILAKQVPEMEEQGTSTVYHNLVQLLPIYRNLEERGIAIDDTVRQRLLSKYHSLYRVQRNMLNNLLSTAGINPLSSVVMNKVIFDVLGYDKPRGVSGTDDESLELLMVYGKAKHAPQTGRMCLECIQNCRKIHKVIEILELMLYPDHRFRCEYNLAGAETGRTSAGKSKDPQGKSLDTNFRITDKKGLVKQQLGHSLQTIGKHGFMIDGVVYGKDVREMFVPSYGYSFVEVDLSQAEARVDAVLARDFEILEIFDGPVGIHKTTGGWVYSCDPLEIKKNTLVPDPKTGISVDRYHAAKTVRHAGERNMREDRLATMAQLPLAEAKRILTVFHARQPNIREVFHKDIERAIQSLGYLVSPNGRRRDFFDRPSHATTNQGISQLPQSIVGDQNKFALIPTMEQAPWVHPIAEAHDSVLVECPIGREMEFYRIHRKNLEVPIDFNTCTLSRDFKLVIPCEGEYSKVNWREMQPIERIQ
jgi:DNA polymerase I-like protein with 3'-5' exonuclease and polymerase domains/uracil-DNA glycosylase